MDFQNWILWIQKFPTTTYLCENQMSTFNTDDQQPNNKFQIQVVVNFHYVLFTPRIRCVVVRQRIKHRAKLISSFNARSSMHHFSIVSRQRSGKKLQKLCTISSSLSPSLLNATQLLLASAGASAAIRSRVPVIRVLALARFFAFHHFTVARCRTLGLSAGNPRPPILFARVSSNTVVSSTLFRRF